MKTKLFTLLLAVAASVGTMFASTKIGDLYYNLNATSQTAEVTYQLQWNENNYKGLTSANIPASLTYNSVSYSVTSIGEDAFSDCYSLASVTIPNSVTSIGERAFTWCTSLTSIEIPNSVTSIGSYAFAFCTGLTSPVYNAHIFAYLPTSYSGAFTIPDGIESIAGGAFYGCTSLTSVTIPNSVTSIGNSAFYYCTSLTSVIWNAKNCADFASNNTPFYANYYDQEMLQDVRFDLRPQITSFTFGNEVEHIPANLCNGMYNLTSIEIPNSITSIGNSAFSRCTGLTGELVIPNSVTCIGEEAFYGCSSLTSVIIPNSVISIGGHAFEECTGLTSVTIPNSVTSIEYGAFQGCISLTSVIIPNSVTSIGSRAFYGCSSLTSVEAPAGFYDIPEVEWPNYTKILNYVIINGGELTENALLFINRSYKTLQTLDVSGVTNTEFADEAFKGYYNLQQLVLPAGLQKVGYMMVAGCKNLQSIDIPASVEEIEQSAFEDCRSIQSITFGDSSAGAPGRLNAPAATASQLRKIGNWAFYNAHELQHLDIPEGVTEIGDGAFYGCTYLEDMTLPASVQAIGDNCFALCAKLTKITCNAVTPPTIQAKTFFDVKRQIPVYVPDEAVSAYENDTYWQEFDIQGQSEVPQGIEDVQGNNVQCTKVLINGQIFILRGDKVYNAQGALVK